MPVSTFIKEGLVRSLAPAAAIGLARMKLMVPKEGAGESTGRQRKQLEGHCRTSQQECAPGMLCQPHCVPCALPHPSGLQP